MYIKLQDGTVQDFFLTALGLLFINIEEVGYERNHPLQQPIRRRPPLEKQTAEDRALILGGLLFGVNLVLFNFFMPLTFPT